MAGGGWRGPQWSIGRATYPVVVRCLVQLLPEDAVLLHEVLDDLLLVAVDPSSEGHEQQPQGPS